MVSHCGTAMYLAGMLLPLSKCQCYLLYSILHTEYGVILSMPMQITAGVGNPYLGCTVSCTSYWTSLRNIRKGASALSLPFAITLKPQGFLFNIFRKMLISALWERVLNEKKKKDIPIAPHESCLQVRPPNISSTYHGRYGGAYWPVSANASILARLQLVSPVIPAPTNHAREIHPIAQELILSLFRVGRYPVGVRRVKAWSEGLPAQLASFSHRSSGLWVSLPIAWFSHRGSL